MMSLDARLRTRRRARASAVRPTHARRDHRRLAGATTRSRLGTRSASPVSALREPNWRCDEESRTRRGDWRSGSTGVMTPAESGVAVMMTHADCRRRDRRTHDEVGGARSEGRRARCAARARLRRAGQEEPARWLAGRQHGRDYAGGIRRGGHDDARGLPTARSAHARRGRRRPI